MDERRLLIKVAACEIDIWNTKKNSLAQAATPMKKFLKQITVCNKVTKCSASYFCEASQDDRKKMTELELVI